MANEAHLAILKSGVDKWNEWRFTNHRMPIELSQADLHEANLRLADLRRANLSGANLSGAYLMHANLRGADLRGADLKGVNLSEANLAPADLTSVDLEGADLSGADLSGATLNGSTLRRANLTGTSLSGADLANTRLSGAVLYSANLEGANLMGANLSGAVLIGANLIGADVSGADLNWTNLSGAKLERTNLSRSFLIGTVFADTDLRTAIGIDSVVHLGPSTVDHTTLMRSHPLPIVFLRGCGLPDGLIEYLPSLLAGGKSIQFYSCFISYSTMDQEFAERLHADLLKEGVRCWFAPHHIQGGKKVHEQIDQAIRLYDRLLLILSPASMDSDWVKTEIAKARKREISEKRRMLFPVRLVDFETLRGWECFDADTGKDSACEIREFFIPDFSRWKTDHDSYKREFDHLLRDLQQETATGP